MKTDPETIKDPNLKLGYKTALREYEAEIALGSAILNVLDNRYEAYKEIYD